MCQMTMNPDMRSAHKIKSASGERPAWIFTPSRSRQCSPFRGCSPDPRIQDILKLYQRSFGMFMLDFESSIAP